MTFLYFLLRLYCLSGILYYYQYTHCFEFTFSSAIAIFTLDFASCASYPRDGVVVRVSALQSVDLGFILLVESYQNTLKNGIYSFPAWRLAFMEGCGKQAGKFACCVLGQGT